MNLVFWKLALRGLLRNKKRSAITAVAFIVGFSGLFILAGYISRIEKTIATLSIYTNMSGHINIRAKNASDYWISPKKYLISKSEFDEISSYIQQNIKTIEFVGKSLKASAQITNEKGTFPILIDGYDFDSEKLSRTHQEFKTWYLSFYDYHPKTFIPQSSSFGISITPSLARKLGHFVSSEKDKVNFEAQVVGLDFESNLNAIDVDVNKIHQSSSDFTKDISVEMELSQLQKFLNTEGISSISVFLKSGTSMKSEFKVLKNYLDMKYPNQFEVFPFDTEEISPIYTGNMGILYVMMGFFIFLIGGAVVLSVLNVLLMSIFERSSEIGTLLSLGFRKRQVRSLFVAEALILAMSGIMIGLVVSTILIYIINSAKIVFYPPGAQGAAFISILWDVRAASGISIFMVFLLIIASYIVTKSQTNKKLVQLLNDIEGKS